MHDLEEGVFFGALNEYVLIIWRGDVYRESDWPYFTIKRFLINNNASRVAFQFTEFLICKITIGNNRSLAFFGQLTSL